jgi:FO synthase
MSRPSASPDQHSPARLLEDALAGRRLDEDQATALADLADLDALTSTAATVRDCGFGGLVTYSRKVFLPLTHLCRDICHYCVFAQPPRRGEPAYLTREQVLAAARRGAAAGCQEALFTLGDKPELRYKAARQELASLGHETTLSYLREVAELVHRETGLLPHLNPGLMTAEDLRALRPVAPSMGIMLESASERLLAKGQAHYGSPDKVPARRLETIALAGEAAVPFTSGILIGIGETRRERIEALLELRELHERHGHIQEVIVQNFRAKPDTRMASHPEPDLEDLRWTIAVARLVLGPTMSVQAPPNLAPGELEALVAAGINDWGGVSPVTPDYVNPEAPWPQLERLREATRRAGKHLVERLTIYPSYALDPERWLDPALRTTVLRRIDSLGYPRRQDGEDWSPGEVADPPGRDMACLDPAVVRSNGNGTARTARSIALDLAAILDRARAGETLAESQIVRLFAARGAELSAVCRAADDLRRDVCGDEVTYVVNRNINYTNVCYFKCQFCAFSKGKLTENLRGKPYDLELSEIARRTEEAWKRGATEVCLQGGIHPEYTGETYLSIVRTVKEAAPEIHVHAFSPLEIWQGAETLGLDLETYLRRLRDVGLGTLPGTAAEILDDEVRAVLCPDKIRTDQWLQVMATAHRVGLRSTATIMFGHLDHPRHWARHLLRVRTLQQRTSGFTELVPLPFVHMEAPVYLKGKARRGPTFRETLLMHAVTRLALHPVIRNIQASWVKLGEEGVAAALRAGVNDVGGTLMNESITRAAGAAHGQEMPPEQLEGIIRAAGRPPRQRTTLYGEPPVERIAASYGAPPVVPIVNTTARRYERDAPAMELVRPGLV